MAGNNQGEPAVLLMLSVALFAGLFWLLWMASREFWLEYFFRYLRYAELWIINLVWHHYDACLDWLRVAQVNDTHPSQRVIAATNACFGVARLSGMAQAEVGSYYQMSIPPLATLGTEAMNYYRWPISVGFAWVAIYHLAFSPRLKFLTKHTLETIIATQAKMWPIISPIVKFNPSKSGRVLGEKVPDVLPPFAEALSPEEFIAWHRIPVTNGIPDREATRRAFIRQLGPRWMGVDALPLHMRALLAAFALKGAQKRDESDTLLGKLALSWSPEKGFRPDSSLIGEIDKILRDPALGGKITSIADQHAWRTTAILGILRWARANGGVLAPAQFLWIRAEDRALWYPLNNLGRRSYHSEGAGAMAHFMAEEAAKKPLPIPRVDTAIVTLNTYLHDPDKRPIPIPAREDGVKA